MQHPEIRLIIKNPNNTLQLAHQPQVKDKLIVKCQKCNEMSIWKKQNTEFKCKKCGHTKQLPPPKKKQCRKPSCSGQMVMVNGPGGLVLFQCNVCKNIQMLG